MEARGEINETWPQAQQRILFSYLEAKTEQLFGENLQAELFY